MNRTKFAIIITLNLLILVISLVFAFLPKSQSHILIEIFAIFFLLLSFVNQIIATIYRFHDINYRGWWIILLCIPVAFPLLCLAPGTKGENKFGLEPKKPTKTEYISLFIIIPLFALSVILSLGMYIFQLNM